MREMLGRAVFAVALTVVLTLTREALKKYLAKRERLEHGKTAEKAWENGEIDFDAYRRVTLGESSLSTELAMGPPVTPAKVSQIRAARQSRRR